ncbi:hypothetical protein BT63DRAFT_243242 [Microthyrium microscopicum]|uniref:Uncharacterized protein n=1 Tax=Microthyrium microscopicum TaxID=703497 RepID=A0A6A6UFP1_9PEZI|nr:hypothetical protein BT63DRAFT_243242 [Microthyrium microscopicum]
MCFYDQYEFACRDFRWGNFKKHCTKEYRRGETCGMKLVHDVLPQNKDCTLCEKIQRKKRRWWQYEDKLKQWESEGRLGELKSTVQKYRDEQCGVQIEIAKLDAEREERAKAIGSNRSRASAPQQSYAVQYTPQQLAAYQQAQYAQAYGQPYPAYQ